MARRGDKAREQVMQKIVDVFGDDFCCIDNKKIYVNGHEGGETIQFAINLTMPKTPVTGGSTNRNIITGNPNDWTEKEIKTAEISDEDAETIKKLKETLGIVD